MTLQQNPSSEPISLQEALEQRADLVFNGKLNPVALAELKFSDAEVDIYEHFKVLRNYEKMTTGQKMIWDKYIIGSDESVNFYSGIEHTMFTAWLGNKDLATGFEYFVLQHAKDASIKGALSYMGALYLLDPSQQTLRTICEIVKRTMYFKYESKFSFGSKRKQREEERKVITEFQDFLTRIGVDVGLLTIFEEEYENLRYQETELDFTDEELNFTLIDKLLSDQLDYSKMSQIFSWLLARYLRNETFRASIRRSNYFSRVFNLVKSNYAIKTIADALKSIQGNSPELEEIKKHFLGRVKKLCKDADTSMKLLRILPTRGTNSLYDAIADICNMSIESHPPAQLIEALKAYSTCMILEILHLISGQNAEMIVDYLSSGNLLHKSIDTRVMAALFLYEQGLVLFPRIFSILSSDDATLSPTDRRKIKDLVQEALALAGRKEEIIVLEKAVEDAIEKNSKKSSREIGQKASDTRRRAMTTTKNVTGPEDEPGQSDDKDSDESENTPPSKRPGELDSNEFEQAIKENYRKLELDRSLAANIGISNTAAGPVTSKIRADLEQTAAAAIELYAWKPGEEKTIDVEPNSVLARLGIKSIRFRKTQSFDVEFILTEKEAGDLETFYPGVHLDDQGKPESRNFRSEPLMKAILELEALRQFVKIITSEEVKDATNIDVLRLLGLESMPAPDPETESDSEDKDDNHDDDPDPPEPDPEPETPNFILENWLIFEEFMQHLQAKVNLGRSFKELFNILSKLSADIQVDKSIPNFGVTVEMPPSHILSPHVQSLDIYDPASSREFLKQLKIDPALLHVDNLDRADIYFVRLNVKTAKGDDQICACIIPPDWKVYFFGVDPVEIIDDERREPVALSHLILKAFKMAVMREDDPDFTSAKGHAGKSTRKGAAHINRIITQATRTSYPPIVACWKNQQSGGPQNPSSSSSSNPSANDPDELEKEIFEKIAVADNLEQALAALGANMRSAQLWKLLPKEPKIVRHKYPNIYMPIDDPAILAELLRIYREEKFIKTPEADDWLLELINRQGTTDADIMVALDFAFQNYGKVNWTIHPHFAVICRKIFKSPNPYRELIELTRQACAQQQHKPGSQLASGVSLKEIYLALRQISTLNPDDLKIATSGAADYRLAYQPREGGKEMPVDILFQNAYPVDPAANLEVVKVIGGCRARMSQASEIWLRGSERSDEMDFASKIQSRLSSKTPEVDLRSRARALLVWEFIDQNGDEKYAFAYLDSTRDALDPVDLKTIMPAEQRLQRFPRIQSTSNRVLIENTTGNHTDFSNAGRWSRSELIRLESQGIFTLDRDPSGHILGIKPGSIMKIKRKKILILTGEQVGYRQFRFHPTNFTEFMAFADSERLLDPSFGYDPKLMEIQRIIYALMET